MRNGFSCSYLITFRREQEFRMIEFQETCC